MRGVAVGLVYALFFSALKETPSHMNLSVAVRIGALLLVPYRLWPTIIAADIATTFGFSTSKLSEDPYNPTWVLHTTLLPILSVLPAAYFARSLQLRLLPSSMGDAAKLLGILALASFCAALTSLKSFLTLGLPPSQYDLTHWSMLNLYWIGGFVGCITLVPVAAYVHQQFQPAGLTVKLARERELGRIGRWIAAMIVPLSIGVVLTYVTDSTDWLLGIRTLLLAPTLVCALLYGWRGAVISVVLSNLAIELTWDYGPRPPGLIYALQLSGFVSLFSLIVGAQASGLRAHASNANAEVRRLRTIAKSQRTLPSTVRNWQASILDDVCTRFEEAARVMMDPSTNRAEAMRIYWQIMSRARSELRSRRNALVPPELASYGLRVALQRGPIISKLRECGIPVQLGMNAPVDHLAIGTQQTLYQVAHEVLAQALRGGAVTWAAVRLRTGDGTDRPWACLRISFRHHPGLALEDLPLNASDEAMFESLGQLASAYGGALRQRLLPNVRTVAVLVFDEDVATWLESPFNIAAPGLA